MLGERHGSLGPLGHVNVAMTSTDGEWLYAVAPRGSTCRLH